MGTWSKIHRLASRFIPTDEQLMWRVQTANDYRAFTQLVQRWEDPIRRLCVRLLGDVHLGEDLSQETFLRLFRKRGAFLPGSKFSTWLWRLALNLCYDELRRRQRRGESGFEETPDSLSLVETAEPALGPDAQAAQNEEGEAVRRALLQLREIHRTVLVLRHYEGLKLREIAEVLQVPEGTVCSRLAEALTRLAHLLKPMFNEPLDSPVREAHAATEKN